MLWCFVFAIFVFHQNYQHNVTKYLLLCLCIKSIVVLIWANIDRKNNAIYYVILIFSITIMGLVLNKFLHITMTKIAIFLIVATTSTLINNLLFVLSMRIIHNYVSYLHLPLQNL